MNRVKLYYCSLCSAPQDKREFIVTCRDDINICEQCVLLLASTIKDEIEKKKGKQHLEDGVKDDKQDD